MAARDSDPLRTIEAMCAASTGLPGFRLFYDHDPRVIDHVLNDQRAAKIVLTRRPIDSYVSLKMARKTGQWWLSDMSGARATKVPFVAEEYADFLNVVSEYQGRIARTLQTTGQTAFHVTYGDLSDDEVLSGLGRYLGADGVADPSKVRAKVQNPTPVQTRLTNPDAAEDALRSLAAPDLGYMPSHEPGRGPGLRFFRACKHTPLLYMPIRGAGLDPIPEWLERMDAEGHVETGMTQKDLRRWKRRHPGHRSFAVLRHPLGRAHDAFCRYILPTDQDNFADIRAALIERYDVPLPQAWPDPNFELRQHRDAFLAFLVFLSGNLGGQTSLRVDNAWASQAALLTAIGTFLVPDRLVREESMERDLRELVDSAGVTFQSSPGAFVAPAPFRLEDVRTDEIEAACEAAYRRDYVMYGFGSWRPPEDQAA